MAWLRALVGLYGLFNLGVGIEAYSSKGSIPSLIAGGGVGVLLLVCFFLVPSKPRIAYIGASVLALLMTIQFALTTRVDGKMKLVGITESTWKPWPNLTLWGVGLIVLLALTSAHFMARKRTA